MTVNSQIRNQVVKGMASEAIIRQYLQMFGIAQMRARAGYVVSQSDKPSPEPAPKNDRQWIPDAVLQQITILCRARRIDLVNVWCDKLHHANLYMPPEWLPFFMGSHQHITSLQALFGERAAWLATLSQEETYQWVFNKDIKPYLRDDPLTVNHVSESKIAQWWLHRDVWYRLDLFALRRQQAPQMAVEELQAHWSEIALPEKFHFIDVLADALNPDDEAFLLRCLDENPLDTPDKGRLAYHIAWILTHLPHSERGTALIEAVLDLIRLENRANGAVIDVRWSPIFGEASSYHTDKDVQALLALFGHAVTVQSLLQLIPVARWLQHWQIAPEMLMQAVAHGTSEDMFMTVWHRRAESEQHGAFAQIYLMNHSWERVITTDYIHTSHLKSLNKFHPYHRLFRFLTWQTFYDALENQMPRIQENLT